MQLEVRHNAHVLLDQSGVCIFVAGFLSARGGRERGERRGGGRGGGGGGRERNGALEQAASHERNRNCTVEGTVSC